MMRVFRSPVCLVALLCGIFFAPLTAFSQDNPPSQPTPRQNLTLIKAVMCEKIEDYVPVNPAIVFSTSLEGICCFTYFDPVPEESVVYHSWFFQDKLSNTFPLSLKPPQYSTVSSIQLREADKGPWRVEITDDKGRLFRVLRFSITD